jgi:OmpA-OmpF porin, OOP family
MRSNALFAILLGASLAACATTEAKKTCYPVSSWQSPVFQCAVAAPPPPAPAPEPAPVAAPEPTPAPEPKPTAELQDEKIAISETVQFETDSAVLLDRSKLLLDEVATVINEHPEIKRLVIEGHTDSAASHQHNMKLSEQRTDSVKKYLIEKGVDAKKLKTKAFGETKPIADNKTEEGRAQNRRVDFRVVERNKGKKK